MSSNTEARSESTVSSIITPSMSIAPAFKVISASSLNGVPKLGDKNYITWSTRLEGLLFNNGMKDVAMGSADVRAADWEIRNEAARHSLFMTIDDKNLLSVRSLKKASEVWEKLKNTHQIKSIEQRVYLTQKLNASKLEGGTSMSDHLASIENTTHELRDMGANISDEEIAVIMLTSVREIHPMLVTAFSVANHANLSIELVKATLLAEEKRQQMAGGVEVALYTNRSSAPYRGNNNRDKRYNRDNSNRKETRQCYSCKKIGHLKRNCPQRKENNNDDNDNSDEATAMIACVEDIGDPVQSADTSTALVSESVSSASSPMSSVWILDSAASDHITHDHQHFKTWDTIAPQPIRVGNKAVIHATARGDIPMEMKDAGKDILLSQVLYSKDIGYNLLSVTRMTKLGIEVTFNDNKAVMKNKKGTVVGTAYKQGNKLYAIRVQYKHSRNKEAVAFVAAPAGAKNSDNQTDEAALWHNRLGHPNTATMSELNKMVDGYCSSVEYSTLKTEHCGGCMQGKTHRTAFPRRSDSRASHALELIHTDICGPMPVPSHGESNYFITFIDDYSRYGVVKLLKHKSDALDAFKEYHLWAEKQTGQKLKAVRSDNGGEFISNEFNRYLKENGVSRQLTAAYTPQQNGIAERRNRTLLESARAMLYHAGRDMSYWGEAVKTASYLKNRLGTRTLVGKTPYEGWWKKKPDISNTRVFGCVVWVHTPKEKRNKLNAKAIECIFVGYSEQSKAYVCWDPKTRSCIVSRDVVFGNEAVFSMGGRKSELQNENELRTELRTEELRTEVDEDDNDNTSIRLSSDSNTKLIASNNIYSALSNDEEKNNVESLEDVSTVPAAGIMNISGSRANNAQKTLPRALTSLGDRLTSGPKDNAPSMFGKDTGIRKARKTPTTTP